MSRRLWSPIIIVTICVFMSAASAGQSSGRREAPESKAPITFTGIPLKDAIKQLCAQLKLNVVFDDTFRDTPRYELELNDVSTEGALRIILIHQKLAARVIENKTIIIFSDNPNTNQRLAEYPAWPARR